MTEGQARQFLKEQGYFVDNLWQKDDIKYKAEDMGFDITEDQIDQVMDNLGRNFNAEVGITWLTIEMEVEQVCGELNT